MTSLTHVIDSAIHHVRTGPRGRTPVVLVHPVGLDLTYWGAQIEALCDCYDVIAYDLPGHGRSAGRAADWTLPLAAGVLEQLIASTGADRAHLVGLSVGGMISQQFAITHPQRVRSLTLIDTASAFQDAGRDLMRQRSRTVVGAGMGAVLQTTIERWFTEETRSRRPDLIDRVTRTLLADDPHVHGAMWDMIAGLDLVGELGKIRCPTLILVGEFDPSSPPAAARQMHEHIADSRLHVIAGASHMAPLERPDEINEHLLAFLDQFGDP
jgi:3-oxoadipate enol-lactonase